MLSVIVIVWTTLNRADDVYKIARVVTNKKSRAAVKHRGNLLAQTTAQTDPTNITNT